MSGALLRFEDMSEKLKIWELVKSIEENTENSTTRYAEARATMLINFGPDARQEEYKGIVNNGDNLSYMITLAFTHLHHMVNDSKSRAKELETWLNFASRYLPEHKEGEDVNIKQVISDILNKTV